MLKIKSQSNEKPEVIRKDCVIIDVNLNVVETENADGDIVYEYDTFRFEKGEVSNDIEALVRTKYSVSDEFAILRQRDSKRAEFDEYNEFVENCKKIVKGE